MSYMYKIDIFDIMEQALMYEIKKKNTKKPSNLQLYFEFYNYIFFYID